MKTRSDSKIKGLQPGQQEYVRRWFFIDNISYEEASARCQKEFGLSVSREALRRWRDQIEKQEMADRALKSAMDRASGAAASAQAKIAALEQLKDPFWTALKANVGQAAFEKTMAGEELPVETLKDLTTILSVGLKANYDKEKLAQGREKLSQSRTKLELELQKYKDACQAASDHVKKLRDKGSDLNESERTAILDKVDEILGIK
jgi:hypothetical protein